MASDELTGLETEIVIEVELYQKAHKELVALFTISSQLGSQEWLVNALTEKLIIWYHEGGMHAIDRAIHRVQTTLDVKNAGST